MEESNYEVPAEETSDKGTCARALYDYQAGRLNSLLELCAVTLLGFFITGYNKTLLYFCFSWRHGDLVRSRWDHHRDRDDRRGLVARVRPRRPFWNVPSQLRGADVGQRTSWDHHTGSTRGAPQPGTVVLPGVKPLQWSTRTSTSPTNDGNRGPEDLKPPCIPRKHFCSIVVSTWWHSLWPCGKKNPL